MGGIHKFEPDEVIDHWIIALGGGWRRYMDKDVNDFKNNKLEKYDLIHILKKNWTYNPWRDLYT